VVREQELEIRRLRTQVSMVTSHFGRAVLTGTHLCRTGILPRVWGGASRHITAVAAGVAITAAAAAKTAPVVGSSSSC
jgi:hypothetical protein